jgi:hypothetical protein
MFCSLIVEPKSNATSMVEEGSPGEPVARRSKRKSEWAQFLNSHSSQWSNDKPRMQAAWNVGGGRKKKWTAEEDEVLERAVGQFAEDNWRKVAILVPGRTSKQCRERWLAKLSPGLVRGDWTAREELILVEKQREIGNQWAKINAFLPGRSPVAVKNRWTWLCRRDVPDHSSEFEVIVRASSQRQEEKPEELAVPEFGDSYFDRDEFGFPQFHFGLEADMPGFA